MADPFPVVSEFRNHPPRTPSGAFLGCAVATCAAIIQRYKGITTTDLSALGRDMGRRHRLVDPTNRCGLGEHGWCNFCIYLELKARGVPAVYKHLTWKQIRAQLNAHHAVALAIWYGDIPRVSKTSYSATTPARGRSDTYAQGHSIVAWQPSGAPIFHAICSDPDFGSASRPRMPSHSVLSGIRLRTAFGRLNYGVTYVSQRPPAV